MPEFKKSTAFLSPPFRKGKNQYKLKKLQRNSGLQKIPTGQK